ncbi:MAG: hypothetical protein JNK58_08700 [Phycisphaerae bacterium]|nr:hypothetical protein [Phycisphaerae bacterium]
MLRAIVLVVLSVLTTLTASPAAVARQEKPDPLPAKPHEDAVPDVAAWSRAYEQAGRPTVMIMCGIDAGVAGVEAGPKWNFELEGVPAQIVSALEEILNPGENPIELVDFNAFQRMQGRFENVLQLNGEQEAINLLREELKAELLITIRISRASPLPKVVVAASEEARGRRGFTKTLDWKGDFSAREIKANIRDVAKRFVEDFVGRAGQQVLSMTIRVLGARGETHEIIRNSLKRVTGMESVKNANAASGSKDQAAEFAVRYKSSADRDDLVYEACANLRTDLDAEVNQEVWQGNTVVIRVTPKPPPPPPGVYREPPCREQIEECLLHSNDPNFTNNTKETLTALYKAKGTPKMTVLLNRRPTAGEVTAAKEASGGVNKVNVDNMIVVGGIGPVTGINGQHAGDAQDKPANLGKEEYRKPSDYELFARAVEDSMSRMFGVEALRFSMVDSAMARDSIMRAATKQEKVMLESELSGLLKTVGAAQIYVIGFATDPTAAGAKGRIQFTFKAMLADGSEIGYGQEFRELPVNLGPEVIDPVARSLVIQIACGILESWKPPSRIEVKLLGATSMDDFGFLRDAIDALKAEAEAKHTKPEISLIGTQQFDRSGGEGYHVFQIEFDNERVPSSRLFDKLREIKNRAEERGKAPFPIFDSERNDDTVIEIRIRPSSGEKKP